MQPLELKKSFQYHRFPKPTISKTQEALIYFPEIPSPLKIGAIGQNGGYANALATANWSDKSINFKIDLIPSYITIFHELGHILQFLKLAPSGEESASIFGLSRIPLELCDVDYIPYFGPIPREHIPTLCKSAIQKRESGERHYLKWAYSEFLNMQKTRGL